MRIIRCAGWESILSNYFMQNILWGWISSGQKKRLALLIAGGLNQVKSEKLKVKSYINIIEEKFKQWDGLIHSRGGFETVRERQKGPQSFIYYKKTEQTHFSLGYRTFPF